MKTIPILKHEFEVKLADLVNHSGLPACVIKPSVANLLTLLEQLEQRQLEADTKAMAEAETKAEEGDGGD